MEVEITKDMLFSVAKDALDRENIDKVSYVSIKTKHIKENVFENTITYVSESAVKDKQDTEFNTNQKVEITL